MSHSVVDPYTFEVAIAAIASERTYQETKWGADRTQSGGKHTFDEWLLYIEDYCAELRRYVTRHNRQEADVFAAHAMRKIAAMAVAAMQQNGIATRAQEGPRPDGFAAG